MIEVFRKKLAYSESSRHYIRILKDYKDEFPEPYKPFIVVIKGERIEVVLDSSYRVWAALFWDKLPRFRGGDTIIFSKNEDGSYTVNVEEGKGRIFLDKTKIIR